MREPPFTFTPNGELVVNNAERYWEGRWRDEAKENERLRAERNLLREMFNSAERELAAERERCAHWKQEADNLIVALRRGVGAAIRNGEP